MYIYMYTHAYVFVYNALLGLAPDQLGEGRHAPLVIHNNNNIIIINSNSKNSGIFNNIV